MKSIRSKLIFWMSTLFMLIGILIYFPLSYFLPQKMIHQILKRDREIAQYLSEQARDPLLLNDRLALSLLLYDNLDRLEDAQYIFIHAPDGSIRSHTFTNGFPKGLLRFVKDVCPPYTIREFLHNGKKMYDIAIPIWEGHLGILHMGVSLESGKKDIAAITKIKHYILIVILAGLGAGIVIFLIVGFMFSNRIIRLKNFATKVSEGNLDSKLHIDSQDEIGMLASSLNEMTLRLKEKIQEIKRLTALEERSRLALDLHDGCAQDIASMIKRLELCQRLFEHSPEKALAELKTLEGISKDTLARTRKIILGLKSIENSHFNLFKNLKDYIIDFEKQNDITVKCDIDDSLDSIKGDVTRSIFYIIGEALTNVIKHAQAKNVELNAYVDNNNALVINIKDDGIGFDVNETSSHALKLGKLGLMSMRERTSSLDGVCTIISMPHQGTHIFITIPLLR